MTDFYPYRIEETVFRQTLRLRNEKGLKDLLGILLLLLALALGIWGVYLLELNGWRF